jgi:cellulose synthase/poly-beta-1,6-N-acetylglucosamine synthase-like glycosyltransferase
MDKVSIIIPCKEIDLMAERCIRECLKLDCKNYEILVLPDFYAKNKFGEKVRIIPMEGKPSAKRNIAMKKSKGEFYAFIDSDAYPRKDWLKNALAYFKDERVGIVGGPNLTPKESEFWEKVSGNVLENFWATLFSNIRYKIARNRYVRELPSCNYIAKKESSCEYSPGYLTAEDSEFCFNCIKKGFKVLYAGDVVVYHHRRSTFEGHVKQMFIYGRDIAWLTKEDFSWDKLYYILHSLGLLIFVLGLLLSLFSDFIRVIFLYIVLAYLWVMFLASTKDNLKITFANFITLISTHFSYGIGWLYGLLSKKKV